LKNNPTVRQSVGLGLAALVATFASAGLAGATATHHSTASVTHRQLAHAQSPSTPVDPAALTHGPGETLLTGSALISADQAATTAVPGATIVRAETNSSGASTYEVHMKKSDGTYVTVELDSNFAVVATIDGFGAGPSGQAGVPQGAGQPPAGFGAPAAA
jgi:uncharacterized membrane protein YkoI